MATALSAAILVSTAMAASDVKLKMVDGKLCARCSLQGSTKSIPATVVIDLGTRVPLVVHSRTAKLLQVDQRAPATVRFGDLVLEALRTVPTELPSLEELSNRFAPELEEIPAVAIVGMPAFESFGVQLDVAQGLLRLMTPADAQRRIAGGDGAERTAATSPADVTSAVIPFEEEAYGYWLAGEGPDRFKMRVRFASAAYDTIIDSTTADLAGSAGGAIDELRVGPFNIASFVALRPEDLSSAPQPRPDVVLGNNLLGHFRVTIDLGGHRMLFEQTRPAHFPAEERAYFVARAKGDTDGIEAFLKQYASSHLASEASEKLLALRLDEYPGNRDAVMRAARLRAQMTPENRRAQLMVMLADELLKGKRDDRYEVATSLLEIGLESAPVDLNGVAAHQINARLGVIALRREDVTQARKRLISAAFGLPRDPMVNLWLGEFYEKTGRLTRAWSRFITAALDRNAPPDALSGLDRLNRNPAFRAQFTMEDAEQLLEGRLVEFHAASRYAPAAGVSTGPVRLVELFTCVDHPETTAPELAFQGLGEFLGPAGTAFVEYHLSSPAADPLTSPAAQSRARQYNVTTAPAAYFDGREPSTAGGAEADANKLFKSYCEKATAGEASGWAMSGEARLAGGKVNTILRLRRGNPPVEADVRLYVILCEKTVMVPGGNQVFLHRHVARGLLSPAEGLTVGRSDAEQEFKISASIDDLAADLDRGITSIEKALQIRFLMRPVFIDAAACSVIGIVQEAGTNRVLAARSIEVATESRPAP